MITHQEFSKVSQQYLLPYTTMVAIMQDGPNDWQTFVDSGSGMFLNTGVAAFLVTNAHVYNRFLKYREKDPSTTLTISGIPGKYFLDITDAKLLGIDNGCDLATLSVPRNLVGELGKTFGPFAQWPQRRVKQGQLAMLVGYPGEGQEKLGGQIRMRPILAGTVVSSVSERHFILNSDDGGVIWHRPPNASPLTHLGGISGSPVYIWDLSHPPGPGRIFVGGFAYEAFGDETVLATHADHIRPDGTIE